MARKLPTFIYSSFYKIYLMEDLLIQEKLKNIIARIFMKNIKKIRSLNTEASKK